MFFDLSIHLQARMPGWRHSPITLPSTFSSQVLNVIILYLVELLIQEPRQVAHLCFLYSQMVL